MSTRSLRTILFVAAVGISAAIPARAQWCSAPYYIEQAFPTAGPEETRWRVCWRWENGPGLIVSHAYFRPSPAAAWINVLWEARVSQLFVPYHPGNPRYLDVNYGFPAVSLTAKDCPASVGGTVIGPGNEVCKQVHDRGLAWKDHNKVRRGEALVLWGVLNAANYNYVMEWTFRDDGEIAGNVGATAVNLPSAPKVTHVHDPMWRIDIDLNGFCCNTVMRMVHSEVGFAANDAMPVVAQEGGFVWDPVAYTMLHTKDATLKNAKGDTTTYMLMPHREGTPRHTEAFSKFDLWVTKYKWNELLGNDLPTYIVPPEPVVNADVVLWYTGGLHHIYRAEDGDFVGSNWIGTTLIMWTGFSMKPMNLFAKTPLYP
jgi:primary-amine oxidase